MEQPAGAAAPPAAEGQEHSTAAAAAAAAAAARITEVHIDGSALLRIVKHCEDAMPAPSTGALLGLDVPKEEGSSSGSNAVIMHVTYAFPLPRGGGRDYGGGGDEAGGAEEGDDSDRAEAARHDYRRHMMKLLKEVCVLVCVCVCVCVCVLLKCVKVCVC